MRILLGLLSFLAFAASGRATTEVVDVPTRSGVTVRVLYLSPPQPKATLLLLIGGHGGMQITPEGKLRKELLAFKGGEARGDPCEASRTMDTTGRRPTSSLEWSRGSPTMTGRRLCMTHIQGNPGEIHELARYEVRPEALDEVVAAIHEFVAHVRENEPGALRYEVWQESERPTRFVHLFVWRDDEANRIHGDSAAVKKFAGILYPRCLAPVEFLEYRQLDANAAFRRV